MAELKPCPFCGSTNLRMAARNKKIGWNGLDMRVERKTVYIVCNKCHARGGTAGGRVIPNWFSNTNPITGEPYDERGEFKLPEWAVYSSTLYDKAIKNWNRRTDDD